MDQQKDEVRKKVGTRLRYAISLCNKTHESIIEDDRWIKIFKRKDKGDKRKKKTVSSETVKKWFSNGLPEEHFLKISEFFNVDKTTFFIENEENFAKKILEAQDILNNNIKAKKSVKTYFRQWSKNKEYSHIEECIKDNDIDLNNISLLDLDYAEQFVAFLMILAIHSGIHWKYWVEKNLKNQQAIKNIFYILNNNFSYGIILRTFYALQKFPEHRIKEYINISTDENENIKDVVKKYYY